MNAYCRALAPLALAAILAPAASAATFTLTPITNTSPTNAGIIAITGTVTAAPGETFYSPNVIGSQAVPFLPGFTAGFTGVGNDWDPAFIAWSNTGTGTYSGPIFNHVIVPGNVGYAGGMPLGLYNTNPFGPGGQPGITLNYYGPNQITIPISANYAVNVTDIPAPATMTTLAIAGMATLRRRRAER